MRSSTGPAARSSKHSATSRSPGSPESSPTAILRPRSWRRSGGSREYRTGTAGRTMGSCSGEGYYFETSLRAGTFLVDWLVRQICQTPAEDADIYQRLEAEASAVPIGSQGLLTLPYWGAVMTPYWDPQARGCFVGLTGSHRVGHLYRSVLEGIALEQALVTGMVEEQTNIHR